jgi:hypothetical protein
MTGQPSTTVVPATPVSNNGGPEFAGSGLAPPDDGCWVVVALTGGGDTGDAELAAGVAARPVDGAVPLVVQAANINPTTKAVTAQENPRLMTV